MHPQLPENSISEWNRIKVLHVDDDEDQLEMTKKFLEQTDDCILVKSESSPIAALKELEHGKFDCVVLDFKMPEMDGIELARRIKKNHNISIILYTGQGSEEVAEKAFAIGIEDYLRKELSLSHYQLLAKRIKDAVEKKRIEVLYKKSEERYRSLVNLAPDGILTLDLKGRITFANPSLLKLTGHKEDEMVGKWFPSVGTARISDLPGFLKTFASIVRGKVPPPTEFVYVRKDGSHGWGEAHVSLITVDGKRRELLAILSDITERKRLLEELENRSNELEIQVEERTRKLLDSERMVAAGRVAAQVGHDLRGPLNTIRNAAYVGERFPEKTEDMFKIINKAVDMSTLLLDEMRTRIQDEILNLVEVDLNLFIANVVDETAMPINYKIEKKLMADAHVSIDINKMKRVLDNLFRNSIDAMPNGGVIFVSTDSNNKSVNISVKDTGCGIPDNVMENLFKPFTTTKINGTGLGLNFVKRIVEAHNGEIRIKSNVGKGTICSITLPTVHVTIKSSILENENKDEKAVPSQKF